MDIIWRVHVNMLHWHIVNIRNSTLKPLNFEALNVYFRQASGQFIE